MTSFVIGIGSNIDATNNISRALAYLQEIGQVISVSSFIVTKPIGIVDQDDFHNGAVLFEGEYSVSSLNLQLKQIEDLCGRDRSRPKFGPREVDLDIVVSGDQVIDKDYYDRDFLRQVVSEVWSKK